MADEIKYEHKTVRAVRGTDVFVISKMENDGWEFVSKTPGTLRSTLEFRRPAKPLPWLMIGVGAAAFALVVGVGIASEAGDGTEPEPQPATPIAAAEKPSPEPVVSPSPTTAVMITARNDPDFAALLKVPDSCDAANRAFAAEHPGETIVFNGSIVNLARHGDYKTRYDILLGPGNRGARTTAGPAFRYENVNMGDLNLTGSKIPKAIGAGDRFRFVAKVGEFDEAQCLFHLEPVSTRTR